jgi:hypothetical protein
MNMQDRVARGLWPHPPLSFSEVLVHLTRLIEQNKWFLGEWHEHREGESINEEGTVERQAFDRYAYRAVRARPIQPRVLAQTVERVFSNAQDAARHLLKWDLHLHGDLDGWKVIE